MVSSTGYSLGTRASQTILQIVDPNMVVDGRWGSYTQRVFSQASAEIKETVARVLRTVSGSTPADMQAFRVVEKMTAASSSSMSGNVMLDARYVSSATMSDIIKRVSGVTNVASDVLQKFLDLEAAKKTINGVVYYDALAVNSGGYSGLFQFDDAGGSWSRARAFSSALPPWSDAAWKDPYLSTLAAACYLRMNTFAIAKFGYKGPITPNIAYLMHNQGAMGAYRIITGRMGPDGKQSGPALLVARAAIAEAKAYA